MLFAAGAVLARQLADPGVGAEPGERAAQPPRLVREPLLQPGGDVRLGGHVLDDDGARAVDGRVAAGGPDHGHEPVLARGGGRRAEAGARPSSRPNAAVGPGTNTRSAGARFTRGDRAQQRVRDGDVERRVIRQRGGDQLEGRVHGGPRLVHPWR